MFFFTLIVKLHKMFGCTVFETLHMYVMFMLGRVGWGGGGQESLYPPQATTVSM
jgi:hypothetical protein